MFPSLGTQGPTTLDGATTSQAWELAKNGPGGGEVAFGDVTGLQGTLSASFDGGTSYINIPSVLSTGTEYAAGAAVVAIDGARLAFDSPGATHAKFTRSAGSGPVRLVQTFGAFTILAALLRKIASGVTAAIAGDVAHDAVDSGNPVKVGGRAVAHGSSPAAVAAGDRTDWIFNRHGVPFVVGGHPNVVATGIRVAAADGAQSNVAIATVSAGMRIVATRVSAKVDGDTTAKPNVTVGFAAATLATPSTTAGAGVLADFLGITAGGGMVEGHGAGILGIGADGEDLRYTCESPTGGALTINTSHYAIES